MKAIILAAGSGTRLKPYTDTTPKCLLEIHSRSFLARQLAGLAQSGIREIIIVTGYLAEEVRAFGDNRYVYVHNPRYETTNSIYSLWLAQKWLRGADFILLNCDIILADELLRAFIHDVHATATLVDSQKERRDGEMNVKIKAGKVLAMNKEMSREESQAESIQITKFSKNDSLLLFQEIDRLISEGKTDKFPAYAFDAVIKHSTLYAVDNNGLPWMEVDDTDDLQRAAALF